MARRILNRKELRADYDAAERQTTDEEVDETTEEEEEDEEEEEAEGGAEAEGDADGDDEGGEDDDEEEAPKKKKKKPAAKVAAPKPKAKPRTRTAKVVRMKVVWGVFNNSNQRVAVFSYPERKDADELAAKLTTDKKSTHFVQPVKEQMDEK